jgi:hypothetical protein
MSDERPKSAYEITMEKLRARDRERGESAPAPLTDDQKKRINELRTVHQARLAEREILYRSERARLLADPEAAEKLKELEEHYQADRRRIEEQRDKGIDEVRSKKAPGKPKKST